MKEDDNGIFMSKKENLNSDTSPKETEDKSDISDKKTINNNLDAINNALLIRACRYNKKNNN